MNIEEQVLDSQTSLSVELANDMLVRIRFGKVVVVAAKPNSLLPSVKKQWLKELRRLQNKRSATLNAHSIEKYTKQIALMQRTNFTAKSPYAELFGDVYFIVPEKLAEFGPMSTTLYVTTPVNESVLHQIAMFMPDTGLVVEYRRDTRGSTQSPTTDILNL